MSDFLATMATGYPLVYIAACIGFVAGCTPASPPKPASPSSEAVEAAPVVFLPIPIPPLPPPPSAEEREREDQAARIQAAFAQREGELARFKPIRTASIHERWLEHTLEFDTSEMEKIAGLDDSAENRWSRGDPRIPQEVLELPPLYAISPAGVHPLGEFAWIESGALGNWVDVGFPVGPVRSPALVLANVPTEGVVVRVPPPRKPVGPRHPMVARWRAMIDGDVRAQLAQAERRRKVHFEVQDIAGRFPNGDRLVVVFVRNLVGDEYDAGTSDLFLMRGDDEVVHRIETETGRDITVMMLFDLDQDGFEEFYAEGHGYEDASKDLYRLTPTGHESITTFEWME